MKKTITIFLALTILVGCGQRNAGTTCAKAERFGEWSECLEIGDALIDKQHRELFEFIIDVIEMSENGADGDLLAEMLMEIVTHTVQHFNDEEALKQRVGFTEFNCHKKIHEEFKLTAVALVEAFEESGRCAEVLADALENIVLPWVKKHITEEDLKIKTYIKN